GRARARAGGSRGRGQSRAPLRTRRAAPRSARGSARRRRALSRLLAIGTDRRARRGGAWLDVAGGPMIPERVFAETLLQFLSPIRPFLDDPSVSEVMINGPSQIFVERKGRLELTGARFRDSESLDAALRNLAQYVGKRVDAERPILE